MNIIKLLIIIKINFKKITYNNNKVTTIIIIQNLIMTRLVTIHLNKVVHTLIYIKNPNNNNNKNKNNYMIMILKENNMKNMDKQMTLIKKILNIITTLNYTIIIIQNKTNTIIIHNINKNMMINNRIITIPRTNIFITNKII